MSFHDALPADVKMQLACQPGETSAPSLMSEPHLEREPSQSSEPCSPRAPAKESVKRREPKWKAKSKVLAGREPGQPAKWGFTCGTCHFPVDEHLRGEHAPGCKNGRHNSSLLEGAEEYAHLVEK